MDFERNLPRKFIRDATCVGRLVVLTSKSLTVIWIGLLFSAWLVASSLTLSRPRISKPIPLLLDKKAIWVISPFKVWYLTGAVTR